MIHIALDVSSFPYQRGVSRYTFELAKALSQHPKVDQITLVGSASRNYALLENSAEKIKDLSPKKVKLFLHRFPVSLLPLSQKWLNYPPVIPAPNQFSSSVDIFHSWDWIQPANLNIPLVSTIHDLAMLRFPEIAHKKILKRHQKSWQFFQKNNTRLICVSQATKKDCVELLGYPPYLIDVVYQALPSEFATTSESLTDEYLELIKTKLSLHKPFILFVGTREPRKNLARLIQAWQNLANDFDLVIVGESGWDGSDQANITTNNSSLSQSNPPKLLGRVSDQVLSGLYALADCFAYPSIYEGFGLPILEAFHFGTPVLTSNTSSMIEVSGNAAELIDPFSVESILEGLKKILYESKTDQQKRLQRMIIRSHMFDWQQTANQTLQTYQKALADR